MFAVNRFHQRYVPGLDTEAIAHYLATGAGLKGSCREYLFNKRPELDVQKMCSSLQAASWWAGVTG